MFIIKNYANTIFIATSIRKMANAFFNVCTGSLPAYLTPIGANKEDVNTIPNKAG